MSGETYGEDELRADFELARQMARRLSPEVGVEVPWRVAWQLYQNVQSAPLGMQLIGPRLVGAGPAIAAWSRAHPEGGQMPDELMGIGPQELENLGAVDDRTPGSVLDMRPDRWNPTINDVWLLAAVHAGQEFHVCGASPFRESTLFHPSYGCSLTGRELVGLALAGYQEARHPGMETVYVCPDPPTSATSATSLRLVAYQRRMESLATPDRARAFLAEAGFTFRR